MTEDSNWPIYEGFYRLDNNSQTGLPDKSDYRDFTFIRIKVPQKKLFFFNKHINCIPISMPDDFKIPPPKNKFRKVDINSRLFKIKFEGELIKKVWTSAIPESIRALNQYTYQNIRIIKFHSFEEI